MWLWRETIWYLSVIWSYLYDNKFSVAAAPAGSQSSDGFVGPHWNIMVHMSQPYLIKNQRPRTTWYYAIQYAAHVISMIHGKYNGQACITIYVGPWWATWSANLASNFLTVLLFPRKRRQRLTFEEPNSHHGWHRHWPLRYFQCLNCLKSLKQTLLWAG